MNDAPKFCPFCGSQNCLQPSAEVFVEEGEFDEGSQTYEAEGNAQQYVCTTCRRTFISW